MPSLGSADATIYVFDAGGASDQARGRGFLCPGDAAHAVASTCLSMPLRNGLRAVHIGLDTHIFLAMNASWHNKHPMPARATLPQRVKWHLAHAKHCGCRPMPKTVRAELRRVAPAAPKRRDRAG